MPLRRAAAIALLVVIGGAATVFLAGSALTHPFPAKIGAPPADLQARSVTFPSASGSTIHGWYAPAARPASAILLLPGVRANRLSMLQRARMFRRAGYSVLLIDFQATGESAGNHITFGWLERLDVQAAVDWLRRAAPGQPVAIVGSSLGGAAALLATPPLKVDALVLESVYPTIERATTNRLSMRLSTMGQLGAPLLLLQLRPRLGIPAEALHPADHIAAVSCPVFIVSGASDRHTTVADTQLLYSRAHAEGALARTERRPRRPLPLRRRRVRAASAGLPRARRRAG